MGLNVLYAHNFRQFNLFELFGDRLFLDSDEFLLCINDEVSLVVRRLLEELVCLSSFM